MIKKVGKRPVSTALETGRKPLPKDNALSGVTVPTRKNARIPSRVQFRSDTLYRYFVMECGHYGCREVDEKYSAWRSNRYDHMCEICGGWRKVAKKPKVESLPDTPLF